MNLSQIDGLPLLTTGAPGRCVGGITFRVGQVDEPPARRGLTHLVEHLALHRIGLVNHAHNGATGPYSTSFVAAGNPEEVAGHLREVARALTDLPFERLEEEKGILRQEESLGGRSLLARLLVSYYGYQGDGAMQLGELGLSELTAGDLKAWADYYFTRDNAVVWLAGDELPAALDLPLPPGARRPAPAFAPILGDLPAWEDGPPELIGLLAATDSSHPAAVYASMLQRALFRALRQQAASSYDVTVTGYELKNLAVMFDVRPDRAHAAVGTLVDTLAAMRWGALDQAEFENAVNARLREISLPDYDMERLASVSEAILTGEQWHSRAEHEAKLRAVTQDQVRQVAEQVGQTALLLTPEGTSGEWAGFKPIELRRDPAVRGKRYPSLAHEDLSLILGPEGASVADSTGSRTVRFGDCVALCAYPDGGRTLLDRRGFRMPIEPGLWKLDLEAVRLIDAAFDPRMVVRMPARAPEDIPRPPAPTGSPNSNQPPVLAAGSLTAVPNRRQLRSPGTILKRAVAIWAIVVCSLILAFLGILLAVIIGDMVTHNPTAPPRFLGVAVGLVAGCFIGAIRLLARYLKRT